MRALLSRRRLLADPRRVPASTSPRSPSGEETGPARPATLPSPLTPGMKILADAIARVVHLGPRRPVRRTGSGTVRWRPLLTGTVGPVSIANLEALLGPGQAGHLGVQADGQ